MFEFPRRKELNVALFSSILSVESSIEEITLKVSEIFRYLLIFRVSRLYIINDSSRLYNIIRKIYDYAILPPYLKKTIPRQEELSKVGLLSPMNIYSHIVHRLPIEGEVRIGKGGNFGFKHSLNTKGSSVLILDSTKLDYIKYPFIYYPGFKLVKCSLDTIKNKKNLILGSRSGKDPLLYKKEIIDMYEKNGITILIGPPKGNLINSLGSQFLMKSYNFIPKQGVSDIRAEEALMSSLSILNLIIG
jgi:predicted SPOUT superfamily RNA methylase MTH1